MNAASTVLARPRLVSDAWPLWLVFGLFPLWWMLGLVVALWSTTFLLVAVYLAGRRGIRLPAGFGIWLLFLAWMGVSLSQIHDTNRLLAYVYRGGSYACATMLFIYVYNRRKDQLTGAVVVRLLALYWCYVAVGGLIATVRPNLQFATPMQHLLPHSITNNKLIYALVHPSAAQPSRILGFLVGRPEMPFDFTNAWGANYALTFPFLVLSWTYSGRRWRLVTQAIALASVVPVVLSLDRGLWISLGAGLVYAAIRLGLTGRGKTLVTFVSAAVVLGGIFLVTPLAGLVVSRAQHGHSDSGRASLYTQAIQLTALSPVFGYGAPQPSDAGPGKPSVGTHGQFWLVLVSQGVPGAVLFISWYAYMLLATGRRRDPLGLWCHIVIVIAMVQVPFYEQLPAPLSITMVAAALALSSAPRRSPVAAVSAARELARVRTPVPAGSRS